MNFIKCSSYLCTAHALDGLMPSYVTTYNAFLSYPGRFLVEISRDKFHYQ